MKLSTNRGVREDLGQFEVISGAVRVTDPCYDTSVWCSGEIKNVRNGRWSAVVVKDRSRCACLIAFIGRTRKVDDCNWMALDFEVGVDSGQAGIFDSKCYEGGTDNQKWYDKCCELTLGELGAGVIDTGCVSSSGYGDGGYVASVIKDDKEVIAIKIDFIEDEDDEDEEIGCGL